MAALLGPTRRMHAVLRFVFAFTFALAAAMGIVKLDQLTADPPDFEQACLDGDPYYVVAALRAQSGRGRQPDTRAPSIVLVRDTPNDSPQYELASFGDTGAVFGLAYNRNEPAVYAGTFRKRSMPFGKGGAGGIYRVDLRTGETDLWAQVPDAGSQTGSRMADGKRDHDENAAREVGKEALGDVEIDDAGTQLFTVNLLNRKIYRYDLATATILSEFEMGAMQESWGKSAGRPFGLAWHQGRLYHGVVNSRGTAGNMVAVVYSSLPDGSDMRTVANIDLRYRRDGVRLREVSGSQTGWRAWSDETERTEDARGRPQIHRPQAILTDLAFTHEGAMVVGLRDRHWDISLQWIRDEAMAVSTVHAGLPTATPMSPPGDTIMSEEGLGFGDLLLGTIVQDPEAENDSWAFEPAPEHFDDTNALRHDESAMGGVAWVPYTDKIVATSFGVKRASRDTLGYEGVYWYELASGNQVGDETVGAPGFTQPYEPQGGGPLKVWAHGPFEETTYTWEYYSDIGSLGDVETLCVYEPPPPTPTQTPLPTDTPAVTDTPTDVPTEPATATPTNTATPIPTDTSTPIPPAYLPISLRERCTPDRAKADTVLVLDNSSSMTGDKIEAARNAALAFLRAVDIGNDQVGVVVFSAEAEIISPLSGDGAALDAAIRGIEPGFGTRIGSGLEAARTVLAGPERKPENTPMIILLTDGIQMDDPDRPQDMAAEIRASRVELYIVGLGEDVDVSYLEQMAGDPDKLRLSPGPGDLAAIYEEIARLIPCAPEAFWGKR